MKKYELELFDNKYYIPKGLLSGELSEFQAISYLKSLDLDPYGVVLYSIQDVLKSVVYVNVDPESDRSGEIVPANEANSTIKSEANKPDGKWRKQESPDMIPQQNAGPQDQPFVDQNIRKKSVQKTPVYLNSDSDDIFLTKNPENAGLARLQSEFAKLMYSLGKFGNNKQVFSAFIENADSDKLSFSTEESEGKIFVPKDKLAGKTLKDYVENLFKSSEDQHTLDTLIYSAYENANNQAEAVLLDPQKEMPAMLMVRSVLGQFLDIENEHDRKFVKDLLTQVFPSMSVLFSEDGKLNKNLDAQSMKKVIHEITENRSPEDPKNIENLANTLAEKKDFTRILADHLTVPVTDLTYTNRGKEYNVSSYYQLRRIVDSDLTKLKQLVNEKNDPTFDPKTADVKDVFSYARKYRSKLGILKQMMDNNALSKMSDKKLDFALKSSATEADPDSFMPLYATLTTLRSLKESTSGSIIAKKSLENLGKLFHQVGDLQSLYYRDIGSLVGLSRLLPVHVDGTTAYIFDPSGDKKIPEKLNLSDSNTHPRLLDVLGRTLSRGTKSQHQTASALMNITKNPNIKVSSESFEDSSGYLDSGMVDSTDSNISGIKKDGLRLSSVFSVLGKNLRPHEDGLADLENPKLQNLKDLCASAVTSKSDQATKLVSDEVSKLIFDQPSRMPESVHQSLQDAFSEFISGSLHDFTTSDRLTKQQFSIKMEDMMVSLPIQSFINTLPEGVSITSVSHETPSSGNMKGFSHIKLTSSDGREFLVGKNKSRINGQIDFYAYESSDKKVKVRLFESKNSRGNKLSRQSSHLNDQSAIVEEIAQHLNEFSGKSVEIAPTVDYNVCYNGKQGFFDWSHVAYKASVNVSAHNQGTNGVVIHNERAKTRELRESELHPLGKIGNNLW